jgi:hypothetical protein
MQPAVEPGVLSTRVAPTVPATARDKPPERARQPHRLGEPRCLALDDGEGPLGGEVPRAESGAARS